MGTFLTLLGIGLLMAAALVFGTALSRPELARGQNSYPPREVATTSTLDFLQLGPGSTVGFGGDDYVVRGSVTLRQALDEDADYYVWWEHVLDGGEEPTWLCVDEGDGGVKLVVWTRREDLDLLPDGNHVVDNETFRESERAHASYTTDGTTDLPACGELEFVDYANEDESRYLAFRRWAPEMPWEIWMGRVVQADDLTVHPASRN